MVVVMRIEIKDVAQNAFNDIPSPSPRVNCKACDYWEGGTSLSGLDDSAKAETKKARMAQGIIGAKILYADGKAVGDCQYGKLSAFARSLDRRRQFQTPISEDATLITCVSIQKEFRGNALGTALLASVVGNLRSKGVTAIEACVQKPYSEKFSSGPERVYLKCGFTLTEELPNLSLMRLVP
jgi:GNAT superfamily N-acetyltransferase